jgi:putative SOS response-associated peptidase YedK
MLKYAVRVLPGLEIPELLPEFTPHAYPKSPSPIVVEEAGRRRVAMLRWGLSYAVQGKPKLVTNARDDQLLKIALWKKSVATRRCLIPVVGYFEPGLGPPGAKGELYFTLRERPAFFIAGLWDADPDGTQAYAMVTTSPNSYTAAFHDRQPVALTEADAVAWLGSEPLPAERVIALTRPPASELMQHEVIPAVPKAPKAREGEVTGELDLGM